MLTSTWNLSMDAHFYKPVIDNLKFEDNFNHKSGYEIYRNLLIADANCVAESFKCRLGDFF